MGILEEKYNKLLNYLKEHESVAVAFSGGVDSTFLLKAAQIALGENTVAITARSLSFPEREHRESEQFCLDNNIRQIVIDIDQMSVPGFKDNPPDRCYLCKKVIFNNIIKTATSNNMKYVAEGSNADDSNDYRPGMKAIDELKVLSPLKEVGLTKAEIRELSKKLGLPTWSKPSYACLATRFVYGDEITPEKIKMVDKAEQLLIDLGFEQQRCRIHADMARIEILPDDFEKIMQKEIREKIHSELRRYGFSYVSLDLGGYRTGSMNEVLSEEILKS